MRRSTGDGRKELLLLIAAGASMAIACGYPRVQGGSESAGGRITSDDAWSFLERARVDYTIALGQQVYRACEVVVLLS
jgi:hypothetical protein